MPSSFFGGRRPTFCMDLPIRSWGLEYFASCWAWAKAEPFRIGKGGLGVVSAKRTGDRVRNFQHRVECGSPHSSTPDGCDDCDLRQLALGIFCDRIPWDCLGRRVVESL